jgi:CheY-like chemotaxis protein
MDSRPLRVLLIGADDDYVLTRDLFARLHGVPTTVDAIGLFADGLEALCRHAHDACLVAQQLDEHTGLELLTAARARGARVPVILLTEGDGEVPLQALQAGAADYLTRSRLVDAARALAGTIDLHKEAVELSVVLARAVETIQPHLRVRQHELTLTLTPAPLRVEADEARLAHAFANLLTNAAKFTESAGRIAISVESEAGDAVVRVKDSGVGMTSERLRHVFEPFSSADGARDGRRRGLGVGLNVARRLVDLHDGSIEARSSGLGQGSEFIVRLPLAKAAAAPRMAAPAAVGAASPGAAPTTAAPRRQPNRFPAHRILVVDDNVDTADMLAQLLRYCGQEVTTAHNGLAAIEAAQRDGPEIILLDIGLPGLNGYEVARRLRQESALEKTLFIALTGYGQDEDRRRSKDAGFHYHFVKPVTLKILEKLLGNRAQLQEFAL